MMDDMENLLDVDWEEEDVLWAKEGIFQPDEMYKHIYNLQCVKVIGGCHVKSGSDVELV